MFLESGKQLSTMLKSGTFTLQLMTITISLHAMANFLTFRKVASRVLYHCVYLLFSLFYYLCACSSYVVLFIAFCIMHDICILFG